MKRQQSRMFGILCGVLFSVVALFVYLAATGPGRLTIVTDETLHSAEEQWAAAAITSYRVKVEVRGRQPAIYEVEVVNDRVASALRNGKPLTQRRTLNTWSVPGMFYTMSVDIENQTQHANGTAKAGVPNVRIRARFDENFGYPRRYHRTEFVQRGANPITSWQVVEFSILDESQSEVGETEGERAARRRNPR
jgi:hypothetical protein